jgi:proteasome lid subunit RPN8/RPN11
MARRDLLDEFRATERDGLEIGTALYGARVKAWGNEIQISRIGSAGRSAVREPRAFGRDHIHEARQAERLHALSNNSGLVEAGFAHSHPGSDPLPSTADLAHLSRMRVLHALKAYAAIIATPARDGGWDLHGWIMREHTRNHDVCERAQIA